MMVIIVNNTNDCGILQSRIGESGEFWEKVRESERERKREREEKERKREKKRKKEREKENAAIL